MRHVRELNLGLLAPPNGPPGVSGCRCLLVEGPTGVTLVDTGFGIAELQFPDLVLGPAAVARWRVEADPGLSALSQLAALGLTRRDVKHVVCTHLDMDHAGGLVDFPEASVHVAAAEYDNLHAGNPRYLEHQFRHHPRWVRYGGAFDHRVFGLGGWRVPLDGGYEISLIPLYGHTRGHCAVAVTTADGTFLHCGDAYYRRAEVGHAPSGEPSFQSLTADDDTGRLASLGSLSALASQNQSGLRLFCTHDTTEPGPV